MRTSTIAALALVGTLCGAEEAWANPFELFGAGGRATAMGGASTAAVDDYTAIHYNPAAMAWQDNNMGMGLMMAIDNAQIRLKPRPDGYDLPNRGRNSAAIPSEFRLNPRAGTQDLLDTYGFFIGAVGTFGSEDFRIGTLVFLPVNRIGIQQTHYPDEREQYFSNQLHFEMLGARVQRQVIMLSASYKMADWLALGAGISFLPAVQGVNRVYLDNPTDQSQLEITLENDQTGRVAPTAGVMLKATERLKLGVAYRGELFFSFKGVNEVQIRGFQELDDFPVIQDIEAVQNYTPHQLALGTSYAEDNYTVSIDVVYAAWSQYKNHQGDRPEGFEDTFTFRLGTEYAYTPSFQFRAGLVFEPSPVPEQTGRTNYVDNDRVVLSLGSGHPVTFLGSDVELSWYMQLHHLLPRDTNKDFTDAFTTCAPTVNALCDELPDDLRDPATGELVPEHAGLQTGNPGFPGFQSFGQILSVGVDLRWQF